MLNKYLAYGLGGCLLVGILAIQGFNWANSQPSAQPVTIATMTVEKVHPLPSNCLGTIVPEKLNLDELKQFEKWLDDLRASCNRVNASVYDITEAAEYDKLKRDDRATYFLYMEYIARWKDTKVENLEALEAKSKPLATFLTAMDTAMTSQGVARDATWKWRRDMLDVARARFARDMSDADRTRLAHEMKQK